MKKLLLSVDLDDLWCVNPNDNSTYLAQSLENMSLLFDKYNIKATLFCIAKDNSILKKYIPELIKKGHEIANHSYSHRYNKLLNYDEKKLEIEVSTKILSEISHSKILGYRAPGWGYDKETIKLLKDLGYKYDASLAISPLFIPLRKFHSIKNQKKTYIYGTYSENLGIYRDREFHTIPLKSAYLLPFYGSIHLYLQFGMSLFNLQKTAIKNRKLVNYIFHAYDFVENDSMISHPLKKFDNHFENLERILSSLVSQRNSITYINSLSK